MSEPTLDSVSGQIAQMSDGTTIAIPYKLTLYTNDPLGFGIRVDRTGKNLDLPKPVTRKRLVNAINVLMISAWIDNGKTESKPEMMT